MASTLSSAQCSPAPRPVVTSGREWHGAPVVGSAAPTGEKPGGTEEIPAPRDVALRLLAYCQSRDWAGYDPYDALNSRLFRRTPFYQLKWPRLVLTQALKRSPLNLRPLLGVPPSRNPKGIALFLSALVRLSKAGVVPTHPLISELTDGLLALRSPDQRLSCWGYNFDWQTRTHLVPLGTPNIICTTFAGNALLDAYALTHDSRCLDACNEASRFLIEDLCSEGENGAAWFNYTPLAETRIHNANLLGAAFLCRVSHAASDSSLLEPALRATRCSTHLQRPDGAWPYGESVNPSQEWVDNFHTGFNLCALRDIGTFAATREFDSHVQRGFAFYQTHFFREDGAPRYFQNATYPIDIHAVAQSIITLVALADLDESNMSQAVSLYRWAMANMWDARGCFHFQKHRVWTNRIPYMRWGQAWMLLALSAIVERPLAGGSDVAVAKERESV